MIKIWWIILLALSMLLAGCEMLGNFLVAPRDAEPTSMPVLGEIEPPALYILREQATFPMDRGNYCWTTDAGGVCADVSVFPRDYTADTHTLVIDNTLELLFEAPFPETVTATLYPENNLTPGVPDDMVEAILDENGKILVTFLDGMNGDYALIISATWSEENMPYGDALYATPIRFAP
jgi:hypothetical protein